MPQFKSRPDRLVVMATNSIAAIDPALLRPGRFDLIIPVGAPDEAERAELAAEFLPAGDPAEVAAAHRRVHAGRLRPGRPAGRPAGLRPGARRRDAEVTADDVLAAVAATRPSVSAESAERFADEAGRFSRL